MITSQDIDIIHKHVDFAPLRDARILITGGTGFVGKWMFAPFDGWSYTWQQNIQRLNSEQYAGAWDKEQWDYIIHLAPVSPDRVIECAAKCGAKILYASSGAVHDAEPGEYALGKIAAEKELLQSGLPVIIARLYTFCGAYMQNRYAVINYIHDAIERNVIQIRGDNVVRTYLYAADMAAWMWSILLKGKPGTTYNVGATQRVSMWEVAREVQKHFANRYIDEERTFCYEPRPVYVPDITDVMRTKMECGVDVWTPFDEAIKRTVEHYKCEYKPKI